MRKLADVDGEKILFVATSTTVTSSALLLRMYSFWRVPGEAAINSAGIKASTKLRNTVVRFITIPLWFAEQETSLVERSLLDILNLDRVFADLELKPVKPAARRPRDQRTL